jgi:hypothetical protein
MVDDVVSGSYRKMIADWSDYFDKDLRAGFTDLLGVQFLTSDQERLIEVIQREPTVGAMGGVNTGKSHIMGGAALLLIGTHNPTKALFGAATEDQAGRLSWAEMQRAFRSLAERAAKVGGPAFTGTMGRYEWRPSESAVDWWAQVTACPRGKDGAGLRGMLHAKTALALLEEVNGIDQTAIAALWTGTRAPGAHFWYSFNPTSKDDAAGRLWANTPAAGRVQLSLLRAIEDCEKAGVSIPGVTDRVTLERDFRRWEGTPLWYTNVLGEFPPDSAVYVVIPKDWYDRCTVAIAQDAPDSTHVALGVDTSGGRAENVVASVVGRACRIEWANRELHHTPRLVAEVERIAQRYGGTSVPIAVDVIGQGGKGVYDQLLADGYNALAFVGGGLEFDGRRDPTGLSADVATWAWMSLREAAQMTVEGKPSVSFPADDVLRDQLARPYGTSRDRKFKLESKTDIVLSPDRADAVAMAWLAAQRGNLGDLPLPFLTGQGDYGMRDDVKVLRKNSDAQIFAEADAEDAEREREVLVPYFRR